MKEFLIGDEKFKFWLFTILISDLLISPLLLIFILLPLLDMDLLSRLRCLVLLITKSVNASWGFNKEWDVLVFQIWLFDIIEEFLWGTEGDVINFWGDGDWW